MAKLVCSGEDIGFTILPYSLRTPIQEELLANPSDYVLGYIVYDKESDEYKFTYTESGGIVEANNHWSFDIIKEFPYCDDENGVWIVYNCSPKKMKSEFSKILKRSFEGLHIDKWDIWSVEAKESKVAVITSWEIY
jgi:hypothetical protein